MTKKKYNDEFSKLPIGEKAKILADRSSTKPVQEQEWIEMLSKEEREFVDPELTVYGSNLNYQYNMLKSLKESDPLMFERAVFCIETNKDPSKLYEDGLIALEETFAEFVEEKKKEEKKEYSFIAKDIVCHYEEIRNNRELLVEYRNSFFVDPHRNDVLTKNSMKESKDEDMEYDANEKDLFS